MTGAFATEKIENDTNYAGLVFQMSGTVTEEAKWYKPVQGVPVPYAFRDMLEESN